MEVCLEDDVFLPFSSKGVDGFQVNQPGFGVFFLGRTILTQPMAP